jgi:hypothetical protein
MFCDRCGATVPQNQRYCGTCGKDMHSATPIYVVPSRVQQHVRMLGILWVAISALHVIGGFAVFVVANTIFGHVHRMGYSAPPGPPFLHALLTIVACAILIKAAFGFLAGWGLLNREPWARVLTIVLSFISLFNVPLGTALGIYGLWVLLPAESEREYQLTAKRSAA